MAVTHMGVPSFYRWLHEKFGKCITEYVEPAVPLDTDWSAAPNPNGVEFDCVYLDFNGLVHACTHPQDRPAPESEEEMLLEVFRLVDRLVLAARPRRLLYLALDGVAPRAKMNQQRGRRYLAASNRAKEAQEQQRLAAAWAKAPPAEWDHNAITPGTAFMHRLGECLRYYCADRVARCAAWARLKVVLSDASVAGEGEHKIMAHIRAQRTQPGYDADTTHCVYGLDADLVMLALATHEPRFFLLRDFVPIGRLKFLQRCDACGAVGHTPAECHVLRAARATRSDEQAAAAAAAKLPYKPLQLLDVALLREYLLHLLRPAAFLPAAGDGAAAPPPPAAATASASASAPWWEGERVLDDVVFLTFLVGNDFLPHLPMLPVYTGGLDVALDTYRRVRASLPGYLIDGGDINVAALAPFLRALATAEAAVAERREATQAMRNGTEHQRRRAAAARAGAAGGASGAEAAADAPAPAPAPAVEAARPSAGSEAWRVGEYSANFGAQFGASELRAVCAAHLQGLAWCAAYYYKGCADWRWHLPNHYAPFAVDLADAAAAGWAPAPWDASPPLRPLQQLVAVLPPLSAPLLPESYRAVVGEASVLRDAFPEAPLLDARGKRHEWQAVVILPFVRVADLEAALAPLQLDDDEAARDRVGAAPLLFCSPAAPLAAAAAAAAAAATDAAPSPGKEKKKKKGGGEVVELRWSDSELAGRCAGRAGGGRTALAAPLPALPPVAAASLRCFELSPPPPAPHVCALLPGASPPPPRLSLDDLAVISFSSEYKLFAADAAADAPPPPPAAARKKKRPRGGGGEVAARAQPPPSGARWAPPVQVEAKAIDAGGLFGFAVL